jgi:hypothetical protein
MNSIILYIEACSAPRGPEDNFVRSFTTYPTVHTLSYNKRCAIVHLNAITNYELYYSFAEACDVPRGQRIIL